MTRSTSVAEAKGRVRPASDVPHGYPGEIYSLFHSHRGRVVPKELINALRDEGGTRRFRSAIKGVLTDYYGCDIRRFGKMEYALVGEWIGKVYLDYTKEADHEG